MSPFRSEAQRRKFGDMVKAGTMSQATFDEWNRGTPEHLPERLHPKEPDRKQAKALRGRARKKRGRR